LVLCKKTKSRNNNANVCTQRGNYIVISKRKVENKASPPTPNKRKERGNKASPPTPNKERREGTKPHPQPLSKERGVICSPIVFYLLSISKAFYSPLLGEGLGVRLCSLSPFFVWGWG